MLAPSAFASLCRGRTRAPSQTCVAIAAALQSSSPPPPSISNFSLGSLAPQPLLRVHFQQLTHTHTHTGHAAQSNEAPPWLSRELHAESTTTGCNCKLRSAALECVPGNRKSAPPPTCPAATANLRAHRSARTRAAGVDDAPRSVSRYMASSSACRRRRSSGAACDRPFAQARDLLHRARTFPLRSPARLVPCARGASRRARRSAARHAPLPLPPLRSRSSTSRSLRSTRSER